MFCLSVWLFCLSVWLFCLSAWLFCSDLSSIFMTIAASPSPANSSSSSSRCRHALAAHTHYTVTTLVCLSVCVCLSCVCPSSSLAVGYLPRPRHAARALVVLPRLGGGRRRLPADEEPAGDREASWRTRHPLRRRRCAGVAAALSLAAAGGRDVHLRGDPGTGVRRQALGARCAALRV